MGIITMSAEVGLRLPCVRSTQWFDRWFLMSERSEIEAFASMRDPTSHYMESSESMACEGPWEPREAVAPGRQSAVSVPAPLKIDFASRLLDIVGAVALIIFLAPVMVLTAIAIYVVDPGPVIFAHQRVGRNGRAFPCLKFRTMYVGAEGRLGELLKHEHLRREWERDQKLSRDPRITQIGQFLRVTSLDELPQLFNVLVGAMSLVGPRPIVMDEVPRYGRFIASYYSVKPGLTGLWQVSGRSSTTYRRRVAADVIYVRSKCIFLDLRILAATLPAVLGCRGSA
jgi:undecaprenyl-phosphate galactose phosphotransferase